MPRTDTNGSILCMTEPWLRTLCNKETASLWNQAKVEMSWSNGCFYWTTSLFQVRELTLVYNSFTDMVLPSNATTDAAFPRLTTHYTHFTQRFVSSKVGGIWENFRSACFQPGRVSVSRFFWCPSQHRSPQQVFPPATNYAAALFSFGKSTLERNAGENGPGSR